MDSFIVINLNAYYLSQIHLSGRAEFEPETNGDATRKPLFFYFRLIKKGINKAKLNKKLGVCNMDLSILYISLLGTVVYYAVTKFGYNRTFKKARASHFARIQMARMNRALDLGFIIVILIIIALCLMLST